MVTQIDFQKMNILLQLRPQQTHFIQDGIHATLH